MNQGLETGEGRAAKGIPPVAVYLFAIWHRGMTEADMILGKIRERFTILKQFDVTWRARDYVGNFAAFYGWKCFSMWFGKLNRSGIGPFRAVLVRDERPLFTVERGWENVPEMLRDENVYLLKRECRRMTRHSNVVHASVNEAETRHNLKALTGESLEEFLARPDLDGSVSELKVLRPIPYVPFAYDLPDKGPRFFRGKFKLNRIELLLLPNCGLPTVLSVGIKFGGLFSLAVCLGKAKFVQCK